MGEGFERLGEQEEGARVTADNAPLRTQHGPSAPKNGRSSVSGQAALKQGAQRDGLGRVRSPDPGPSVRVTVRLGLVPNSLAFWRRRRYGTAAAFAQALAEAAGFGITPAYVRYWETAVGVPPARVIEAVSQLLEVPPTLIWTQEQLRTVGGLGS